MSTRFLTAEWRDLAMLNFRIDPGVLAPYVPAGTSLDLWDGHALVSVVGFRFLQTRVCGVAVPGHRDFDEINLRFYVRRPSADGDRRGVTFIREIVPRRAIALTARLAYNEPYLACPMRSEIGTSGGGHGEGGSRSAEYAFEYGRRWHRLRVRAAGVPEYPAEGSEAEFITEHYWGYTRQRHGRTIEYEVQHPQWRVWSAMDAELQFDVDAVYGAAFTDALSRPPCSAFLAEGSPVAVLRPRPL